MIEYFGHKFIHTKLYNGNTEYEWNNYWKDYFYKNKFVYFHDQYEICEVCKLKFNSNHFIKNMIPNNIEILTCTEQQIKNLLE